MMMVTFVSECEKKALNRTRRVLDAFANRIGRNTWQTVISKEGLDAVRHALKQSASRNTAVSCHWIRSRSRSDLKWVVGNKDKFNSQGIVAVNYTNQENILKIDDIEIDINSYVANTKKQSLVNHLFAVGYVSYLLCKQLTDNEKLAKAVFIAGCWHDMGKIDSGFQQWVMDKTKKKLIDDIPEDGQHIDKAGKFSFEKHPRHNEISLLLFSLLDDERDKCVNVKSRDLIKHSIYWHHAKPNRKEEIKKLDGVYNKLTAKQVEKMIPVTLGMLAKVINLTANYGVDLKLTDFFKSLDDDRVYDVKKTFLAEYKNYGASLELKQFQGDVKINARNNIARTVLVSADRLVSSLSAEALNAYIEEGSLHTLLDEALLQERGLTAAINVCLQGFEEQYPASDRNKKQSQAVQDLNDGETSVMVLQGPAGCGKTKIALEWAASNYAKKIIWVCPRVQVCQGLVNDLISKEYLPHTKIEICTGEFKSIYQSGEPPIDTPEGQAFSGDIVLTTIDQVINTITTHTKITGLIQYMNAHVVFDEYHEYIPMAGFNLLFAELVACKQLQSNTKNALLVSATPNYSFVQGLLDIHKDDIISIKSFNQRKYHIEFQAFDEKQEDESNPLYQQQLDNTFVISNTAITAQRSFIQNQGKEQAILIHSKFKPKDRKELFNKVFKTFKEDGDKGFVVLRAGPIIQASLNITCKKMVTEMTNAENWLQRMGRLDRFGKSDVSSLYLSAVSQHVRDGKCLGNAKFLNGLHCLQSSKAWLIFLEKNLPENKTLTIDAIYQLYQDFYKDKHCLDAIEQDLLAALKVSVQLIGEKIIDPISFPSKKKPKNTKVKIKNNSLRGNSRFVQMAVMNIGNGLEVFPNDYACDRESFTLSVELITGYGESERNLLAFMAKKHHNIKEDLSYGVKKTTKYKDSVYLKKSKEEETPLYLSYTREDLKKVEAEPHFYAVYYAVGTNQPIGAMSAHQINNQGEEG
ncbi:MAG: CRISPR-associated endonuclease Cas3'' [Mariprofundaceae bacterium]|nr:CRISPR-associated endonuclease Cas3'' [Mariprofundaceae bacterium]